MNKMNYVFAFRLHGTVILFSLALLVGCAGLPSETRYNTNIKTYSTSPSVNKYTVGMHENVTAYYILRDGGSSAVEPEGKPSDGKNNTSQQQQPEMSMVLEVSDVLFEFDKWVIKEPFLPELDQWADYFNNNPQVTAEIYGYTDSTGPVTYNQKLSENRAQAVVHYLVEKGVDPNRLNAKGLGESHPAASNDTRDGRQKNRRVELKL